MLIENPLTYAQKLPSTKRSLRSYKAQLNVFFYYCRKSKTGICLSLEILDWFQSSTHFGLLWTIWSSLKPSVYFEYIFFYSGFTFLWFLHWRRSSSIQNWIPRLPRNVVAGSAQPKYGISFLFGNSPLIQLTRRELKLSYPYRISITHVPTTPFIEPLGTEFVLHPNICHLLALKIFRYPLYAVLDNLSERLSDSKNQFLLPHF